MRKVLILGAFFALLAVSAQAQNPAQHKYTSRQATKIALKRYPGKVVGKVPLENEEGKWQYAVTIRSGKKLREVMVGADSGKIESVEVTTKAEEAKEAAADRKKSGKGGH